MAGLQVGVRGFGLLLRTSAARFSQAGVLGSLFFASALVNRSSDSLFFHVCFPFSSCSRKLSRESCVFGQPEFPTCGASFR